MLYRAALRFLVMIAILAGVRIGACSGPVRHTNEGPLPASTHSYSDAAPTRSALPEDVRERMRRNGYPESDRLDPRTEREKATDELIRALAKVEDERTDEPVYRPGQPMADTKPSR